MHKIFRAIIGYYF